MKRKLKLFICVLLVTCSFASVATNVTAYDDAAAQQYADKYVFNYNSKYRHFDADCTNFVSQCMLAGGVQMDSTWYYKQGLVNILDSWSHQWSVADDLKNYVKNDLKATRLTTKWKKVAGVDKNGKKEYAYINNSSNITGRGIEIVFYDWTDDGHIDHASIIVGTNTSYDGTGYGDLINQHTTDRQHTVWHLDSYNDNKYQTAIYVFRLD